MAHGLTPDTGGSYDLRTSAPVMVGRVRRQTADGVQTEGASHDLRHFPRNRPGFWLISAAWPVLYRAQRDSRLATTGPYRFIRHPQYAGFELIMTGFLLQWPTLLTLAMFPVLLVLYWRLAVAEERETAARFGPAWAGHRQTTPAFVPRLRPVSGAKASRPQV